MSGQSNITESILATVNGLNAQYRADVASTGSGYSQAGWPEPGEHNAIIKGVQIAEDDFWVGKDQAGNKIPTVKCPAIKFVLETIPDTSDPMYNPDVHKACHFTGEYMHFVPADMLGKGHFADDSKGPGFRARNERERFKGWAVGILGEEQVAQLDLGAQLIAINEVVQGDDAVHVRLKVDSYENKDKKIYLTDYCLGGLQVASFSV